MFDRNGDRKSIHRRSSPPTCYWRARSLVEAEVQWQQSTGEPFACCDLLALCSMARSLVGGGIFLILFVPALELDNEFRRLFAQFSHKAWL